QPRPSWPLRAPAGPGTAQALRGRTSDSRSDRNRHPPSTGKRHPRPEGRRTPRPAVAPIFPNGVTSLPVKSTDSRTELHEKIAGAHVEMRTPIESAPEITPAPRPLQAFEIIFFGPGGPYAIDSETPKRLFLSYRPRKPAGKLLGWKSVIRLKFGDSECSFRP